VDGKLEHAGGTDRNSVDGRSDALLASFRTLVAGGYRGPAYAVLDARTGPLRHYLRQRFDRWLGGQPGIERLIHRLLDDVVASRVAVDDELTFCLFRLGVRAAKQGIEAREMFFAGPDDGGGNSPAVAGARVAAGRQRVERAIAGLSPPLRAVAELDLRSGGRLPTSRALKELGVDTAELYRLRERVWAELHRDTETISGARLPSDAWFRSIAELGYRPDLTPLEADEAREEFARIAFDDAPRLTESIVLRAQAGSPAALSGLVERYQSRVLRRVRGRLGEGLRHHVESVDIVQDVFAEAMRSIRDFVPGQERSFHRWICTIIENRIRNVARHQRARPSQTSEPVAVESAFDEHDQEAELELQEQQELVRRALTLLPTEQRSVLHLRMFEGRSYREISDLLEKSEPAIQMQVTRAKAALTRIVDHLRRDGA
jgi:RNA polymerase sigma-70 factor (ECF subfamily)